MIEIFENLDGEVAPDPRAVPEGGGAEALLAALAAQGLGDLAEFEDRIGKKKPVLGDAIDQAQPGTADEKALHRLGRRLDPLGDVVDHRRPGVPVFEDRLDPLPQRFVLGRQLGLEARQEVAGAPVDDGSVGDQGFDDGRKPFGRHPDAGLAAEPVGAGPGLLGRVFVPRPECGRDAVPDFGPVRGRIAGLQILTGADDLDRVPKSGLFVAVQVPADDERGEIDPQRLLAEKLPERIGGGAFLHGGDSGKTFRPGAAPGGAVGVEYPAAGDGPGRRLIAKNESVAAERADPPVENDLHQCAPAGRDVPVFEDCDTARNFGGAQMDMDRRPVLEGLGLARQHPEPGIEPGDGIVDRVGDQPVAPVDVVLGEVLAGDVEGAALTGRTRVGFLVLGMDAAHPDAPAAGGEGQLIAHTHRAREHRAGDDQAGALEGECPVDGEAEIAVNVPLADQLGRDGQMLLEFIDPVAGHRGHGQDFRSLEARLHQQELDLFGDVPDPRFADPVGLGQRDHALIDSEEVEDRQVLLGLGHGAVVGGDDQQRVIDAGNAGQHVANEALVTRHIDKPHDLAAGHRLVGEAQIDGHAAFFLFRQPVGVDPGQCLHQQGLAVVDVAGGGNDHRDAPPGVN